MENVNSFLGIIYCYISPSGKYYVGQTYNESKRKWLHKSLAYNLHDKTYNYKFYQAIRKYGWDSFEYKVLITIEANTKEELSKLLDEKEIYYIKLYDSYHNGYNMTIGGKVLRGEAHPSYGSHLTEEHKQKLKDSVCKLVSLYDMSGNYIATYPSAASALLETGCDSSQIIAICRGKAYTSKGFQWRYGNSIDNIGNPNFPKPKGMLGRFGKDNPRSKPIYLYSFTGELITIWEGALCAEREAGYSSTALSRAIKNKIPYGKRNLPKYIWSFTELKTQKVLELVDKYNKKRRKKPKKKTKY